MGDISFAHGPTNVRIAAVLAVLVGYDSNPKTKLEGMALWTVSMRLELSSLKMFCLFLSCVQNDGGTVGRRDWVVKVFRLCR